MKSVFTRFASILLALVVCGVALFGFAAPATASAYINLHGDSLDGLTKDDYHLVEKLPALLDRAAEIPSNGIGMWFDSDAIVSVENTPKEKRDAKIAAEEKYGCARGRLITILSGDQTVILCIEPR